LIAIHVIDVAQPTATLYLLSCDKLNQLHITSCARIGFNATGGQITPQHPTDIEVLHALYQAAVATRHALVVAKRAERDAAPAERDQARLQMMRHLLRANLYWDGG
jgi:hypothetical protein